MPRTKKPNDTRVVVIRLPAGLQQHLVSEAHQRATTWTQVLNEELRFVRELGLTDELLLRLQEEVNAQGRNLQEVLRSTVSVAAWRKLGGRVPKKRRSEKTEQLEDEALVETTANIAPLNLQHLRALERQQDCAFTHVLGGQLELAWRCGLRSDVFERLEEQLRQEQRSVRGWVTTRVLELAVRLLSVPVGRGVLDPGVAVEDDWAHR